MSAYSLIGFSRGMVRVGLWLAHQGGWTTPVCTIRHWEPCRERHWEPCLEKHWTPCPNRHWEPCTLEHWPKLAEALQTKTAEWMAEQERLNPHGSGENKRHLVYAKLLKDGWPKRDAAVAMEYVLWKQET